MSYTEELNQVRTPSNIATESNEPRSLIPFVDGDGSIVYKKNRAFRGEVFPLDIKKHSLKIDPEFGWKHFNFDPESQKGKQLISKYINFDEDGFQYIISSDGRKVYGENEIQCEVLNLLHMDYMNKRWVRIRM